MPESCCCGWCGKDHSQFSEWGQQTIGVDGKWMSLCVPCTNRRLNNPLNALLGMRKIGESE